jgi:hypothetical protein
MSTDSLRNQGSSASRISSQATKIELPDSLTQQLVAFRNRVWTTKVVESVILAFVVVCLSLLMVYLFDRWIDTPQVARVALFLLAALIWFALPRSLYRWVWKHRRLEQLARLLRVREPLVGDQLLSAIELAHDDSEQARSRTLCAAAIGQVADTARKRDLSMAAPLTRLKPLAAVLLCALAVLTGLYLAFPLAFENAFQRLAMPWRNTPRFTFASIEPLQSTQIVPHGEASELLVRLSQSSHSKPQRAYLHVDRMPEVLATLGSDGAYRFAVPPLTNEANGHVRIGDFSQVLNFQPMIRPQLTDVVAQIRLPEYLQRPATVEMDARSGKLAAVDGSLVGLKAVASRELVSASLNDSAVNVDQASFRTDDVSVSNTTASQSMNWKDIHGLTPLEPFSVSIQASADEPPSVVARELPRQMVVMDSEQVNFEAMAGDDFGLRRIGMSWRGIDESLVAEPAKGERVLAAGGPEQNSIQTPATFCASALGIAAQPIELRLWAEDYLPDRERVYSSPHILFVLTPDQHAIWIMDQLSKWHKASIDVRDKEMALYEENKRLRELSESEMADEKLRDAIKRQAAMESSNARRLASLTQAGESLLKTASRNPEIGVGHLDRWAEMLQVLNDIGNNRMPSVSDLLDEAAIAKSLPRGKGSSKPSGPQVGKNRGNAAPGGSSESDDKDQQNKPALPKITDQESSLAGPADPQDEAGQKKKKKSGSRLTLPTTTIASSGPNKKEEPEENSEQDEDDAMDEAIEEQTDLLVEFQKIADEMNDVLANLEGSTLVKRLKAASREQVQVAEKISSRLPNVFGLPGKATDEDKKSLTALTQVEETSRQAISFVMDDMQAYFERRKMNQFKLVLDEMVESKILDALTDLGQAIPKKQGVSIAQAEYWADNLDRWADDLVDPACSGKCPGCKSSDALPPSMILEALRILEAEVNLREATRVAEQAKAATSETEHQGESKRLSETQDEIRERTDQLIQAIVDLPEGESRFPKEIKLLGAASNAMNDAQGLLAKHDTGSAAIAAETEAIEWLLQSKKINPRGGGGGGSDPGGGGGGTTQDSALALMGSGTNVKEKREARNVSQTTGERSRVLPEEFRQGLDQYFNQLEQAE